VEWPGKAAPAAVMTMGMERMKRRYLYCFLGALAVSFLLVLPAGCSKNGEEQPAEEKGAIEKMTDQAAESAVRKIRSPIDKARDTKNLGTDRMEEMDQILQKQ